MTPFVVATKRHSVPCRIGVENPPANILSQRNELQKQPTHTSPENHASLYLNPDLFLGPALVPVPVAALADTVIAQVMRAHLQLDVTAECPFEIRHVLDTSNYLSTIHHLRFQAFRLLP